jgi:chromate transporter
VAAGLIVLSTSSAMQLGVVAGGALLGPWVCRNVMTRQGETFPLTYGPRTGMLLLSAYAVLLVLAVFIATQLSPSWQIAAAFYRTGALVFGGGHVVLPLLKQAVVDPGWINNDTFLTGYGAAQAVPGPMFTLAAFLGERLPDGHGGVMGAVISLLAIFLPGLLAVSGCLPFWRALAARDNAARMLAGVNAAVVGILAAALYNPVWVSAVRDGKDFAIALIGFALLVAARQSALVVVLWCVVASVLRVVFL